MIHYDEIETFLDWFINYAKNQFVYENIPNGRESCVAGPTYHLSIVKNNWDDYPKQIWNAYNASTN